MSVASVAASIARRICDVEDVGYSQPDRRTWYSEADWEGHVKSPQNADCSSLVCGAVNYGLHDAFGVPWGHKALLEIDDFWTGNMRGGLEARGFQEVPWEDASLYPDGGFQTGDVVLSVASEGGKRHVIIIADAANDLLSEAWIAETGDIYGRPGDQTGQETRTKRYSEHPFTRQGAWTSCHRFSEAKFLQQWPEFAKGKPVAPAAPAASSEPAHAHGVDVSSYQTGIDFSVVPADFVIVKVTQGCWYTNPAWQDQAASAVGNGKRLGLYHFVDDDADAVAQAEFFLATAADYLGRATLWLDWEGDGVALGPGAAQVWLDTVAARTGTTPGFYTYQNVTHSYDWSGVSSRYPLWIAGGPDYSDYGSGYMDPAVPNVPYWGTSALVHQYTEDGRLPGWGDHLDLDRLRDRSAWDRMIGGGHVTVSAPAASPAPTAADGQQRLDEDGEMGPATIARFQQVMGTPVDGELDDDGSPAVEAFQRFLNSVVGADAQEQLNGESALDVDGIAGPATWRVFQYLVMAWHPEYVPADWDFGDWIDGDPGEATIRALQRALNNSHADSGHLW